MVISKTKLFIRGKHVQWTLDMHKGGGCHAHYYHLSLRYKINFHFRIIAKLSPSPSTKMFWTFLNFRHPSDTLQIISRHLSDTHRQSPKFRHVGSCLLLEARCGLFLPSSSCSSSMGKKVNSYSNQLKLSWVCKLEWSLTTT